MCFLSWKILRKNPKEGILTKNRFHTRDPISGMGDGVGCPFEAPGPPLKEVAFVAGYK